MIASPCQRLTSPSRTRFDAVSAELLNWILKSKSAIQNTEMKEFKKLQETSGMKKKLKVKSKTSMLGNKNNPSGSFCCWPRDVAGPRKFCEINVAADGF